ncbi:hypothetical protein LUZ60_011476 [Juncus effusus]|nr:hypothetical protein LUZ60_011476 [Juncus effusus]
MATTEGLKQRSTDKSTTSPAPSTNKTQKTIKTKRGIRSLTVAITVPVLLFATSAYLSGTAHIASHGKFVPPILAFHLGNIAISAITGFAAWLIWAKGGFHRQPQDMFLYFGQLLLGLMWGPLMFKVKDRKLALAAAVAMAACMFGCIRSFRRVNKVAGDIFLPCFAWAVVLAIFSFKSV